jgi:hypothetical protein
MTSRLGRHGAGIAAAKKKKAEEAKFQEKGKEIEALEIESVLNYFVSCFFFKNCWCRLRSNWLRLKRI